jgi:hypothetical protein
MTAIPNIQTKTGVRIPRPSANTMLWAAQIALGALFVFAGAAKLMMSSGDLADANSLPVGFMRFIGVAELLGGFGLVLPGLGVVRFARVLMPLAAAGLAIIMVGAVTVTVIEVGVVAAVFPLVVGIAVVAVLRGRRSWISA